jgi:phage tail sheath protein FI
MAETLLSPGVLARENDQSFLTQQPVQAGAALIGPTVLGEVNIPTLVTSYSDFTNRFGSAFLSGGQLFSYLTNISAFNYFQNGGTTLLVTRVASGSWTSANSTPIYNENETGNLVETLNALSSSITTAPSASVGTYLAVTQSATSGTGTGAKFNIVLSPSSSTVASIIVSGSGTGYTAGDTITISSASLGATGVGTNMVITLNADDIVNQDAFVLKTISEGNIMNNSGSEDNYGALTSGSAYNIRWQIVNRDVTNGIFSLLIRQGDDTTDETNVLETWTNLSLDPTQPNYISAVLGDTYKKVTTVGGDTYIEVVGNYPNQSRYVYVSQVNALTPAYFDNAGVAKNQYTGSIPLNASGSFTGGIGKTVYGPGAKFYNQISGSTNIQGINAADYNTAISLLANQDEYLFNNISAPGLTAADNTTQITNLISLCQNRGDSIAIIDTVPYGAETATVIQKAGTYNTSYAATYWPWLQTIDPSTGQLVWVPASTMIPSVYAFTDSVSDPWFAPAGINRGGLATVVRPEQKLTQTQRNNLYVGNVNPIAVFPSTGVSVYGQKTLQKKASALDRVNVRRLLISLKSYISQVANNLVFEQNTIATRNQFLSQINPYLESVQQRQGLYAFRVIMDDSNNTPDVIDRNQLIGQIYLQPTKTAEFIYLDFNILPTGASFPA